MGIPVILDTDIGSDIDDTWALAFLLRCPELDIKLVVTDRGCAQVRAKLACQILEAGDRTDVPVALGPEWQGNTGSRDQWVRAEGYALSDYAGGILTDGAQALADAVMAADEPMTVIAIGPMPTLQKALALEPAMAERARFVGMHGSVRKGYLGSEQIAAEANVKNDPAACRDVFAAPWEVTITPLDTCGLVQLSGDRFARVCNSENPLARAVMDHYRAWWHSRCQRSKGVDAQRVEKESSTLFDTVAVYLAFSEDLLKMETLGIQVTDDGFTRMDPSAKNIRCATTWQDGGLDAFCDLLVNRLAD